METTPTLERLPLALRTLRKTPLANRLGVMERLFGQSLATKEMCWVETAPGIPWKVDLTNPCHRWMVYGDYADPGFLSWARRNVPKDGVIVDSGANIGQFLPYFAGIASQGRILAFEPSSYCCKWVWECLDVNQQLPIELVHCGLGEVEEELFLDDRGREAHGLWGELKQSGEGSSETVKVRRLGDELEKRGILHVNLWKLDVEGHEVFALEGARSFLRDGRVSALYIELSLKENNHKKIIDYMSQFGYKPHEISRSGGISHLEVLPDSPINALFLPAES